MQLAAPPPDHQAHSITEKSLMPRLMQVKGNGFVLHWPDAFPEESRGRGLKGYVVDADHPLEKGYDEVKLNPKTGKPAIDEKTGDVIVVHVRGWIEGQYHKLEDAPADAVPNTLDHPTAIRVRSEWETKYAPKSASAEPAAPAQNYARRKPQRAHREIEA